MKSISAELAAHLEQQVTTLATCLLVTWKDGSLHGYTSFDQDIEFDGGLYHSTSGYDPSDVATSADMNVDNLEIVGLQDATLTHPSITDEDLLAGLWDYAEYRLFQVNWNDLSQGRLRLRRGKLGEVSLDRWKFRAELRGLLQFYATTLGRMEGPSCNATFGDARCGVNLDATDSTGTLWKRSGTLDSVSGDGLTLFDAARTEDGPTDSRAVTGVTNANPGVISYASAFDPPLVEGESVILSGIVGPATLNTTTIVRNPGDTSFELGVDTSDTVDYPAYVSGGTVSRPDDSGFFDFGLITMVGSDNANAGLSREIKSYVPGQFVLQEVFPYPVQAGDEYIATAGCDKSLPTCRDRYNNVINFRGFPYLPGTDKIIQVGRHNG